MLDHLLNLVEKNPEESTHYLALIQAYNRNGDQKNEMKWIAEFLEHCPQKNWEQWLRLAHYQKEIEDPSLWQTLLSAYYFRNENENWPESFQPPFQKAKQNFLRSLNSDKFRVFDFNLTTPKIHIQYILRPSGIYKSREYLEEELPKLLETNPLGVIFEWSSLRDVDTFLGGFLAMALEQFEKKKIPVYLVPPNNSSSNFIFQFLQLSQKLEQLQVRDELEAIAQLRTIRLNSSAH